MKPSMRVGELKTRDLINLPEGMKNSLLLFYFLFCSIAMSTGFVWLFLTVSYDVIVFRVLQAILTMISVFSSLSGIISPCFIRAKIPGRVIVDKAKIVELHQKLISLMLTFGMLFILSCFSIYNIYWRKQIMQDDDYVHEVERVPGQSDKPPAYDTLTLSSPPPKYESVVRISHQTTKSCLL